MPLVTSGQFAYDLQTQIRGADRGPQGDRVGGGGWKPCCRCFRGYLKDRNQRYGAIQRHIRNQALPFLSDLTYASEGILVEGHRFPILFMKWMEGPTAGFFIWMK